MIAHVGGVPVEELLPVLVTGATGLLLAFNSVVSHVRASSRTRHPGGGEPPEL